MKTIILLLLLSSVLSAAIINIPADYALIQDGIISADNGDTVLVQPGTYAENLDFYGRNITVGSLFVTTQDTSYIAQTVIDGNQNGSVVAFTGYEDSTAVLSGFTLINGSGTVVQEYPNGLRLCNGGGIYCLNSSPLLEYLTITGCTCNYYGGGVYLEYSSSKLHNLKVISNTVELEGGGGICARYQDNCEIADCRISDNTDSSKGGGICIFGGGIINIYRTLVSNNFSNGYTGGVYLLVSGGIIEDSEISGNCGINSGGIYLAGGSIILQNSLINGNSGEEGGGIFMYSSMVEFSAKTSLSQKERGERYLSTIHYFLLHQIMSRQENYDK